jgi:ribonuclease P/MRP protein subunit RPP1
VQVASKKGKGKQQSHGVAYNTTQINAMEARVDLLVRCESHSLYSRAVLSATFYSQVGYTVIGFNQLVHKKVEPKTHVNILDNLVSQLRQRPGIVFLKRLSVVLDEDSEKGFGLVN